MKRTCGITICDKPSDAFVCKACGRDLEQALAETPWLVDELETVLTRQTAYGNRSGGGRPSGRKSTPLVFDVRASAALDEHRRALRAAVDLLYRAPAAYELARGFVGPQRKRETRPVSPNAMSAWLMLRVGDLRNHPDGPELVERISKSAKRANNAVDRPADKWYAGQCWQEDCKQDMYASVGSPVVTCRGCGLHYDVATRRDYLTAEAEDQLTNAATIARAVSWLGAEPLTAARVRQWASRGRIRAHAYDRCPTHLHEAIPPKACKACSPLYRVGDAIDLLAADTNRKERAS